ncbi:hypothetical protein FQA39_LY07127 [Lamprigera yunnana]|nr:hypothetical protein FQA39_LY07127 [Lamprigera yunnana]
MATLLNETVADEERHLESKSTLALIPDTWLTTAVYVQMPVFWINPLTNEELQELIEKNMIREDANSDIDVEELPVKVLTTKILSNCPSQLLLSNSLDILFENESDFA